MTGVDLVGFSVVRSRVMAKEQHQFDAVVVGTGFIYPCRAGTCSPPAPGSRFFLGVH